MLKPLELVRDLIAGLQSNPGQALGGQVVPYPAKAKENETAFKLGIRGNLDLMENGPLPGTKRDSQPLKEQLP